MHDSKTALRPQWFFTFLLFLLFGGAFLLARRPLPETVPVAPTSGETAGIPDFSDIHDVDARKEAFFNFLEPYINAENQRVLANRQELLRLLDRIRAGAPVSRRERAYISSISEEYEIDTLDRFTENHLRQLLRRVDVIPASLALAQAANESAWGTSRFALEGNSFFGQWCYTEGCGLVPSNRRAGANHEVRAYDSVAASVHDYFMNINTFPRYQKLRRIRQNLRERNQEIDGLSLVEGLDGYSERGWEYIEELRSMIDYNDLHLRDPV